MSFQCIFSLSMQCENLLKTETAKFQSIYEKFNKEKATHLQSLRGTFSNANFPKELDLFVVCRTFGTLGFQLNHLLFVSWYHFYKILQSFTRLTEYCCRISTRLKTFIIVICFEESLLEESTLKLTVFVVSWQILYPNMRKKRKDYSCDMSNWVSYRNFL